VLTQFAERVAYEPELLLTWRGIGTPGEIDVPDDVAAQLSPFNRAERDSLDELLGTDVAIDVLLPDLVPLPHVQLKWDEPWSVMLHDALRVLTHSR
jgi:hypothetical protein